MEPRPTAQDFQSDLRRHGDDALSRLGKEAARIQGEAAAKGAHTNSRVAFLYMEALESHWRELVTKILGQLRRWTDRTEILRMDLRNLAEGELQRYLPLLVRASKVEPTKGSFSNQAMLESVARRVDDLKDDISFGLRQFDIDMDEGAMSPSQGHSSPVREMVSSEGQGHGGPFASAPFASGPLASDGAREVTFVVPPGIAVTAPLKATELGATTTGGQLDPLTVSATGILRDPIKRLKASEVRASSTWTGRRSPQEQAEIVAAIGPVAWVSVEQLISAIEMKRLNDPATHEALAALKELHHALGELIDLASRQKPLDSIWSAFEDKREKLTNAIWDGAQVMIVSPAMALGAATILSWLSGVPISDGMVTALCATGMSKDAVLTLAKRR